MVQLPASPPTPHGSHSPAARYLLCNQEWGLGDGLCISVGCSAVAPGLPWQLSIWAICTNSGKHLVIALLRLQRPFLHSADTSRCGPGVVSATACCNQTANPEEVRWTAGTGPPLCCPRGLSPLFAWQPGRGALQQGTCGRAGRHKVLNRRVPDGQLGRSEQALDQELGQQAWVAGGPRSRGPGPTGAPGDPSPPAPSDLPWGS